MTNSPDDQIDPYEARLTRRVGEFAEQAVRPFDPAAVSAAAHAGARRRTLAGRLLGAATPMNRIGIVLAGALVVAGAFGIYLNGGRAPDQPSPAESAKASEPAATWSSLAAAPCPAADLEGSITSWDGAAGHRIAGITVRNAGSADCALFEYMRPALVDADGHSLIVGGRVQEPGHRRFAPGETSTTMVDMANYCGNAPTARLLIRFYLPDNTWFDTVDRTNGQAPLDAPPCNGPNVPAMIQMQPMS